MAKIQSHDPITFFIFTKESPLKTSLEEINLETWILMYIFFIHIDFFNYFNCNNDGEETLILYLKFWTGLGFKIWLMQSYTKVIFNREKAEEKTTYI